MFAPARVVYAVRPHAPAGLLAAAGTVAMVFSATPFLIPAVAERFGVGLGWAGLISVTHMGGFALAAWQAPRWLTPGASVVRWSLAAVAAACAASAVVPAFAWLLVLRLVTGAAEGAVTWVAWADAAGHARKTSDVAAVSPASAVVAAPLHGWLVGAHGDAAVWLVLALLAGVAAVLPVPCAPQPARQGPPTRSGSRSNNVLLAALFLMMLSASGFYMFTGAAIAALADVSPVIAAGAFSLNAMAGIVGTRVPAGPLGGGAWIAMCGVPVALIVLLPGTALLYVAMAWWGFAHWVALPAVFALLAERSLVPDERIGDAHSAMALGRVAGPLVVGLFAGGGHWVAAGLVSAIGLVVAGALVMWMDAARRIELGPAWMQVTGQVPMIRAESVDLGDL